MRSFQYVYKRRLCLRCASPNADLFTLLFFHRDGMMHRRMAGTNSHPAAVASVTRLGCPLRRERERGRENRIRVAAENGGWPPNFCRVRNRRVSGDESGRSTTVPLKVSRPLNSDLSAAGVSIRTAPPPRPLVERLVLSTPLLAPPGFESPVRSLS